MFQIVFGLVKDMAEANWGNDILRSFFTIFERLVFTLIPFVYEIFYKIASNTIISGDIVEEIFTRTQNIFGILMIFVLSISILQYIINPDLVTDKAKGAGSIIKKVIVVLLLLTMIRPLSIPSENVVEGSYNDYLRKDGLLFGTLYSFQNRIIQSDFLGNLILGNKQEIKTKDSKSLNSYGNELALTILKSSIRKNSEVCSNTDDFQIYDESTEPNDILDNINEECGGDRYSFAYFPLIGFIEGAFILIALISFCVDVAVRAIKLAILRIIAPIPIISYASPNSSQNSAFSTWMKEVIKTYVDLFIRLAIVFFIILIVKRITQGDLTAFDIEKPTDVFAIIFIIIGLFMFAKNAPQFIYDSLGIKREKGQGLLSGLSGIKSGIGTIGRLAVAGLGTVGSAATNYRAAKEENMQLHPEHPKINFLRNIGSTLTGAVSGGVVGAKAAFGKDANLRKVIDAQNKRNMVRASHSTGLGRFASDVSGIFTGQGLSAKDANELKYNNDAFSAFKNYKSTLEDEATKRTDFYGSDKTGSGNKYNYIKLQAAVLRARNSGADTFDYNDGVHSYAGLKTDLFDENTMNDIKSSQAASYADRMMTDASFRADAGTAWNSYKTAKKAATDAGNTTFNGTYSSTKMAMGQVKGEATTAETEMRNIMRRANDRQSNK